METSKAETFESLYTKYYTNAAPINYPRRLYVQFFKPCIDISVALILTVLLLPICIIISIAIRLDSEGPVLFRQDRYGKNGTLFGIYKFRTMHSNVPKQGRSPFRNDDSRITRVGRMLRKTSLDEIPQLLNILRGEMSFIGPRPEQKLIVDQFYTSFERFRFLVTPGITGIWQTSPDRISPIHENLQHDYEYIEGISLWLDMKIVFKTLKVIIKSNTY
jgi:undecaprenyl phosphate N,N'-diacetylbacillosamine 1-phosphate transferase